MTQRPRHDAEIWSAIDAACNGDLSDEEQQHLAAQLAGDRQLRDLYADYMLLHTDLIWAVQSQQSTQSALDVISGADDFSADMRCELAGSQPWRPMLWLKQKWAAARTRLYTPRVLAGAGALTVLFWMVLGVWMYSTWPGEDVPKFAGGSSSRTFAAQLAVAIDCRWEDDAEAPLAGQFFRAGRTLRLESGTARIDFLDGATAALVGPAEFTIRDGGGLLTVGAVTCRAPSQAKGFTIATPWADFVDLGTEFAVVLTPGAQTAQSHVFEGSVQVHPAGDDEIVLLKAGSSILVDAQGKYEIRPVAAADRRWNGQLRRRVTSRKNLPPSSYDIPNGDRGKFEYLDDTYSGDGHSDLPRASLRGGLGRLTDGWSGPTRWEDDPGAWVGWKQSPTLVFHFARPVELNSVVVSTVQNKRVEVMPPRKITVTAANGETSEMAIESLANGKLRLVFDDLALQGDEFTIQLENQSLWILVDEISFYGIELDASRPE
jgi:hypothetical protein